MNTDFDLFIKKIVIGRCRLNERLYQKYFTTEESKRLLIQAFTHKSVENEPNYELLELEGDVILNASVVKYIRKKFPDIINVGYVTRIKHNLISKQTFSSIAIKNGFFNYARLSNEFKRNIVIGGVDYINMNEDLIETTCGAISTILDNNMSNGIGFKACYNFISSYLNEMDMDTDYDKVFDAKSRLKLLMDLNNCNFTNVLRTFDSDDNYKKKDTINQINKSKIIYSNQKNYFINLINETKAGFISKGFICVDNNVDIAVIKTGTKKDVDQVVAAELLDILDKTYNKRLIPVNKYKQDKYKKKWNN